MAQIGVVTSVSSVGPQGSPDVSEGNFFLAGQTPWGIDGVYQPCPSFPAFVRLYGGLNKLVAVGSPDVWTYETTDAVVQAYYSAKTYFAEKGQGSPGVLMFSRVVASSSGPTAATGTFNDVTAANPSTFTCKFKGSAGNTQTVQIQNPSPRAVYNAGAGTVTTTTSSGAVTGSGTAFAATDVGKGILIGGVAYTISAFTSSTSITITPTVGTGAAGQSYSTALPSCLVTVRFPQANITEVRNIASAADAADYSARSELVTLTLPGNGNLPGTSAATKLTSGSQGTTAYSASDADYVGTVSAANVKSGLQCFNDQRLGLGYVAVPGKYSATVRTGIATHSAAYYRLGLLSSPSGLTLSSAPGDLAAQAGNALYYLTPQVKVADENSDSGGSLLTANEGLVAGLAAKMIRDYNGPHKSPAGKMHPATSLTDIERQSNGQELYDDPASNTLADSNINTIRVKGGFVIWGNRTLATDKRWGQFNTAQTICKIVVVGQLILEKYVHEPIDPQGKLFATVKGDFGGLLLDLYKRGALYGTEPLSDPQKTDAFSIVCDRSNNPDTVLVNNEFRVDVSFVPTPNAEKITFTVSPAAPGYAGRTAQ